MSGSSYAASRSRLPSRHSVGVWKGASCAQPFLAGLRPIAANRPYDVLNVNGIAAGDGVASQPGDLPSEAIPAEIQDIRHDSEEDSLVRRRRVEAVLLLSKGPVSPRKLAQLAQVSDATEARTHVRDLQDRYQQLGRAMRIELIAGGYRMMTRPALAPWLSRLSHIPAPIRLSTPMLETLAIVAYRGPIARSGIEAVRGVACGELLRQLMERDLIRIAGRSEELGRPYLYGTTKGFLQLFGLANLDSLPPIQWQTLHEDMSDSTTSNVSPSNSSPPNPSKEPVVSTLVAPEPSSLSSNSKTVAEFESMDPNIAESVVHNSVAVADPVAAIEDEEDDLYEGVNDDDDDDWDDDDDDWDDDDDDDDDDDLDEDDDDDEDDDELDDDWEEVDDSDDDEDDLDEESDEESDEELEDDDEAWDDDDSDDDDDDEDDVEEEDDEDWD